MITCASANGRPSRSDSVHLYAYGDYSGGGDGWTYRCGATTLWNQITADSLLSFDEGERAEGRVWKVSHLCAARNTTSDESTTVYSSTRSTTTMHTRYK